MTHTIARPLPAIAWGNPIASRSHIGWLALVICILGGSTYNVFAKQLQIALSPLSLFFISELLTGFFVLLSYGVMPVMRSLLRVPRKCLLPLLGVGLASGTLAPLLLFPGLRLSTAVNATLYGNLEPFFLVILAVIFLRERFRREHLLCMAATVLGTVTIALRGFSEGLSFQFGDLLLILSSMTFAIGSILFRRYLHHLEPHVVLFARALTAVSCFFVLSPFLNHTLTQDLSGMPLKLLPVLLGFGFVSRFVTVFTFYQALDRLPVTTVSLLMNTGVITSAAFAHWMLGESIFGYHWIGGAFIILGTVLLEAAGIHRSKMHLEKHLRQRTHR